MHTHSKSYYEITNQEFTCAKWASIAGTIPIDAKTKAHLQKGNIVFEWDFEKYGCKNNPGVGPALGTVRELNRHTAMINWADENSLQADFRRHEVCGHPSCAWVAGSGRHRTRYIST